MQVKAHIKPLDHRTATIMILLLIHDLTTAWLLPKIVNLLPKGKNLSTLAFLWVGDLRTTAAGLSLGDVVGILELDSILHTSILS